MSADPTRLTDRAEVADPLLGALEHILQVHGIRKSREALLAGLPVQLRQGIPEFLAPNRLIARHVGQCQFLQGGIVGVLFEGFQQQCRADIGSDMEGFQQGHHQADSGQVQIGEGKRRLDFTAQSGLLEEKGNDCPNQTAFGGNPAGCRGLGRFRRCCAGHTGQ